jgi:hypothetical protein
MRRVRLNVCVSADVKDALAVRARQRGCAMAAIVEAAIHDLLTAPPKTQELRREREMLRALEALTEMLALYINVYLSITPEVPPEQHDAARTRGAQRYQQFMQRLEAKLQAAHGGDQRHG